MNATRTLLLSLIFCLMHCVCFAQEPTPPMASLQTTARVYVGNTPIVITVYGYKELLNNLNHYTSMPTTRFKGDTTGGQIVNIDALKGAGNENKYCVLYANGMTAIRAVSISGSTIQVTTLSTGKWTLPVSAKQFRMITGDMYVCNFGVVGRSSDHGATWTIDSTGIGVYVYALKTDTNQGVYATDDINLFYKVAGAGPWSQVSSFPTGVVPRSIYVDRRGRIFVGTSALGVYSSTNGGASWTQGITGIASKWCIRMCDDAYGNIYMESSDHQAFRSSDAGLTWTRIDIPITQASGPIPADIQADSVLMLNTTVGRFFSSDTGHSWTAYNEGLYEEQGSFYKTQSGRIVKATINGVFYLDSGASVWQHPFPAVGYKTGGSLQTDSAGNMYMYTIETNTPTIYKSTDNGTTWQYDTAGAYQINSGVEYFVDEAGREYLSNTSYYIGTKLYTKLPGGSYTLDMPGIVPTNGYGDEIVGFGSDHHGYVYLSTAIGSSYACMYRRPLSGGNWVLDSVGLYPHRPESMISDANHTMIATDYLGGRYIYYRTLAGPWREMQLPVLPHSEPVTAMGADNSGGVLIAFDGYDSINVSNFGYGVYCTRDYGATWHYVGLKGYQIYSMVSEGDTVYAITVQDGVYAITCDGVATGPVTTGLPGTEHLSGQGLSLYPNPTKDICHAVRSTPSTGKGELTIYDVAGRAISTIPTAANTAEISFSTTEMSKGLYICTWRVDGDKLMTGKLIVEK